MLVALLGDEVPQDPRVEVVAGDLLDLGGDRRDHLLLGQHLDLREELGDLGFELGDPDRRVYLSLVARVRRRHMSL